MPLPTPIPRLLLTGAAGALGRVLRPALKPHATILRVSDRAPLGDAVPGEETIACDLADAAAVRALLTNVDAVVHMGGFATDGPMATIFASNIVGVQNLYEAARVNRVKRIVFASSNHVIGFYPRSQKIDTEAAPRPDSYYGVSKAFGEDLSRYYFDRCGIETVCLRIGSARAAPTDRRMLATWLSLIGPH